MTSHNTEEDRVRVLAQWKKHVFLKQYKYETVKMTASQWSFVSQHTQKEASCKLDGNAEAKRLLKKKKKTRFEKYSTLFACIYEAKTPTSNVLFSHIKARGTLRFRLKVLAAWFCFVHSPVRCFELCVVPVSGLFWCIFVRLCFPRISKILSF